MSAACTAKPMNPSFPITFDQARRTVGEMRQSPVPLQRPLVVIGGFIDPGIAAPYYKRWFKQVTRDGTIIAVSIGCCGSFESCRRTLIEAIDEACPSHDPIWTREVDVLGASLGGLVARYAAAPAEDPARPRRLRIARLFTISSPHSGATLASALGFTQFHRDMRAGSGFLQKLAESDVDAAYQMYSYVRLHDEIVGVRYAAPPGVIPWWVPNPRFTPSHLGAMCDERILADIALRLRGEKPLTSSPAAALPSPG